MHLTPIEFDLLQTSPRVPDAFRPRRAARQRVGRPTAGGTRNVDSHIRSIRRKLGTDIVRTVHGVGYAVEDDDVRGDGHRREPAPDPTVPSIKLKLGIVILAAVAVTIVVFWSAYGSASGPRSPV